MLESQTSCPSLALETIFSERIRFNLNTFSLVVEYYSFVMVLTTPSNRKYWLGVSFELRIFSFPRKISLETKSPTLCMLSIYQTISIFLNSLNNKQEVYSSQVDCTRYITKQERKSISEVLTNQSTRLPFLYP